MGQTGITLDGVSGTRRGGVQRVAPEEVPSPAPPATAGSGSGPNTAPLPPAPSTAKQIFPIQLDALIAAYDGAIRVLDKQILHGGSTNELKIAMDNFERTIDAEMVRGARQKSYRHVSSR